MGGGLLYHKPKRSFDMYFLYEYTHISSSRGHMGLIRLPAQAPLSHLQNPAEVKVFLPPFIPAQTPGTWKQRVFVINVEVILLVKFRPSTWPQGVRDGTTTDGLCGKRPAELWYCRVSFWQHVVPTCADDFQEIHLRHGHFFVTQFFMKSIVSLSYSKIKY